MEAADVLSGENKCLACLPQDGAEMAILQRLLSLSALSTVR